MQENFAGRDARSSFYGARRLLAALIPNVLDQESDADFSSATRQEVLAQTSFPSFSA